MPLSQLLSLSVPDTPDATAVLMRIHEAISQMLGPIAEISRMLPTLKWIAEALEDKRDAAGEIARLYEAHAIPFRTNSGKLLEFSSIPFAW
jgi:hypothetical protein